MDMECIYIYENSTDRREPIYQNLAKIPENYNRKHGLIGIGGW